MASPQEWTILSVSCKLFQKDTRTWVTVRARLRVEMGKMATLLLKSKSVIIFGQNSLQGWVARHLVITPAAAAVRRTFAR